MRLRPSLISRAQRIANRVLLAHGHVEVLYFPNRPGQLTDILIISYYQPTVMPILISSQRHQVATEDLYSSVGLS